MAHDIMTAAPECPMGYKRKFVSKRKPFIAKHYDSDPSFKY